MNEIVDVYEGKDAERNAYFQVENDRREILGDNYTPEQIQKTRELVKEDEKIELLSLYSRIKAILKTYMDMSEYAYHIITLWIIGTYCYQNFTTFPLMFINAVKGSGKSRLLKLIESMAWNGRIQANLSESVVFRSKKRVTMLIDEFEQVGSKHSDTLRELINASYKKGGRVERMKEVKKEGSKDYEVESFDLFSPLVMANIWGMDDTVKDRCIVIHLDKSDNQRVTKLMEDFDNDDDIIEIRKLLTKYCPKLKIGVDNVDVDKKKGVIFWWNCYIKSKGVDGCGELSSSSTLSTLSTLFNKIDKTGVYGRDLELFFPLFIISNLFGENILTQTLEYSSQKFKEKNLEEYTENPDVVLLDFLWKTYKESPLELIYLNALKSQYQLTTNVKDLDNRTLSKSLERLNVILDKKRDKFGVKVLLDFIKINSKLKRYGEHTE